MRTALRCIPIRLAEICGQLVARIASEEDSGVAIEALSWIVFGQRPLTSLELETAIAVDVQDREFQTALLTEDVLVDMCAGFLSHNNSTKMISLPYSGMREILQEDTLLIKTNTTIAQKCLICLRPGFFTSQKDLQAYAMDYWVWHLQRSDDPHLRELLPLLREKKCVAMMCGAMNTASETLGDEVPRNVPGLSLAAYHDLGDAVSELAKDGSITSKDSLGMSALHWAAIGCAKIPMVARSLLRHGADIDHVDAKGRTPLHLAMSNKSTFLVEYLIACKADTRRRDARGNTLLHRAAQFGVPDMVLLLLERYKDMVEARNLHKQTPLHHAAGGGQSDNVMLLLKMGASIHAEDRWGRTPRDLAAENKHVEVVEILDEYLPTADADAAS
jgi:hypothetical protein